jgi:hypothetical protein
MRIIAKALYLFIFSINCCIATAQTIPGPENFSNASDCEATRHLPSSTPVHDLGNGFRGITRDSSSNLAACFGVYYGHHEILETCTRYPTNFNLPCIGSSPNPERPLLPIDFAVMRFDDVAVRLLVDHGATVTGRHLVHDLVFSCAAHEKLQACRNIIALLVRNGSDINDPAPWDSYPGRDTPLTRAWSQGWFEMAYALIDLHADLNATNTDGCTVLDLAEESKVQNQIEYLRTRGAQEGATCAARKAIKKALQMPLIPLCLLVGCRPH